ncbi:hypothetical protein ACP4OV_018965 [Aristida adscensionis]
MISVLPTLLLLLATSCETSRAGRNGAMATSSSLLQKDVCSGPKVTPSIINGTWLPLYHRRSPCSPSSSSRTTTSMASMLPSDKLRAESIQRQLSSSKNGSAAGDVTVPTTLGSSLGTLQYVVAVRLGTPGVAQTVHIDTGSDLSWVQCRPCSVRRRRCHPQKDAFFDPARSSTYSAVACRSAACAELARSGYANGCSKARSLCKYVVNYSDGSNTTGTYSSDELALTSSAAVAGFRFGCSHADEGGAGDEQSAGLLGLGGGAQSLVSQLGERAFSYCLPATASATGFLTLGAAPPRRAAAASRYAVTPMYRAAQAPTFYLVRLQAIAVAGRRLRVPPSAFAAGVVLDSGTIVTRLPPAAYRALRAAFRKEMAAYPRARPRSILDTCYDLGGAAATGDIRVPRVALVFDGGAAVELHPSGVMEQGCLAFAPTGGDGATGIIGNVQQRTLEVLYDVGGGAVGFRRGVC